MRLLKHAHFIGAGLSFTCGIHCIAAPLLIAIIPAVTLSQRVSIGVLAVSTILSLGSLCWGFRQHTKISPLILLSVGFFLLMVDHRNPYHIPISIIGSICFLASYLINIHLCRSCHNCKDH